MKMNIITVHLIMKLLLFVVGLQVPQVSQDVTPEWKYEISYYPLTAYFSGAEKHKKKAFSPLNSATKNN